MRKSNWLMDERPTCYDGLRPDPSLGSEPQVHDCLKGGDNAKLVVIDIVPEPTRSSKRSRGGVD